MRILLLICGDPDPPVAEAHGPYPSWFDRAIGPGVTFHVLDPRTEPCHPGVLGEIDAVIISGSPYAAYDPHPWIPSLEALVRTAVFHRKLPVLGVCFGHQLLAQACGGRVVRNPRGREIGSVEIVQHDLARSCPLMSALPPRFWVNLTHCDTVIEPPPGARVLAWSEGDDCQAFAFETAFGVQFHPEFSAEIMRSCIEARRARLAAEGLDVDALLARVRETDAGRVLFARFVDLARKTRRPAFVPTAPTMPLRSPHPEGADPIPASA